MIPSGPSILDMVANMAFYYGLVESLVHQDKPPEMSLEFALARENFYKAAKHGMNAHVLWLQGNSIQVSKLVLEELMELAWLGLERLGIEDSDIKKYLCIIEQRVLGGMNGANWQRQYVARHGHDMRQLLQAYRERQSSGLPVHEWEL